MKLVEMNFQPTDHQLRQFGVIALVALPLLGYLWSAGSLTVASWSAAMGAALAILGLVSPQTIKPVYVALCVLALPVGILIGELAMAMVFFALFLPLGIVFRLIGRDALQRTIDRRARTYWQPKKQPADPASYLRQW